MRASNSCKHPSQQPTSSQSPKAAQSSSVANQFGEQVLSGHGLLGSRLTDDLVCSHAQHPRWCAEICSHLQARLNAHLDIDSLTSAGTWKQCPEGHEVGDFVRQSQSVASRAFKLALSRQLTIRRLLKMTCCVVQSETNGNDSIRSYETCRQVIGS